MRLSGLVVAVACVLSLLMPPADAAPGLPVTSAPGAGAWSLIGASVPYANYRCDFGCAGAGVRDNERTIDTMLRNMSQRGVQVVRWYLFPGDAWQIGRNGSGVVEAARADLVRAVQLAEKHDVYLLPVFLPTPDQVPSTWFTDPSQRAALAATLQSLVGSVGSSSHVLGWEVATGAELLATGAPGAPSAADVRATTQALAAAVHSATSQLVVIAAQSNGTLPSVQGLGANSYALLDPNALNTARPVTDAPVFLAHLTATSAADAAAQLNAMSAQGYVGALLWAWAPGHRTWDDATWRWEYAHPESGPRSRPLNPCIGPSASSYRCPNLKMSKPSGFTITKRNGKTVLLSRSSINNVGTGPASIRGRRTGPLTMDAWQLLTRKSGAKLRINTGARLKFKAIPGQYRYWKWNGAARMELWRLDASGTPVERVRVGPKTVYCLRDLERTKPSKSSPKRRVYPGCNQNPKTQQVTLGTSPGWSDIYPASYFENWIAVGGLRGCFAYVHIVDPDNVIYESNENDNISMTVVRLPWNPRIGNRGCPGAKPLPTLPAGPSVY